MQDNYSISTGYSLDTDRYDASIAFDHEVIAQMYLREGSKEIMIEFNDEFTPKQAYNLTDFIRIIKEAEESFREYLAGDAPQLS